MYSVLCPHWWKKLRLVVTVHTRYLPTYLPGVHLELRRGREGTHDGNGVVDVAVGEEVGAQALLLDLPRQHLPHPVRIVEQIPHLHTARSINKISKKKFLVKRTNQ